MSIGDTLAEARRQAGLTVTQVSQRTRIRESILRAIEQNDFSPCGGDFYARGHIRSIAKVVGVDPVPLVREYDAEHGPPGSISAADIFEPATPIRIRQPRRIFGLGRVMAVFLLAVIGAAAYYLVALRHNSHTTATPAATVRPVVKPTLKPTPKPTVSPVVHHPSTPEAVIVLTAHQDCWVGLTSASGAQIFQGIIPAGESRTWREPHSFSIRIGNPGGIALIVNGKAEKLNPNQVDTVGVYPISQT